MKPEKFNLNHHDLETIVKRYYQNPKLHFRIQSSEVSHFSTNRVGYLGDHFFLKLKVILEDEENREDVLDLFFKVLPTAIPALTSYLEASGTSRKETRLYGDLFARMAQFTRFAPKAYLTKDDRLLVLENLALEGYRSVAGADMGIFDKAHLEQALKALARFHCASLMLETKTGRTLPELCPGALDENCWVLKDNNPRVEELENAIQVLCELVKVVEKGNPKLPEILNKLPQFILQIYDLVKPSDKYRNVSSHGDLWGSNLLFNMFYYGTVQQIFITSCLSPEEIFPERPFRESCERYKVSGVIDNFLMNHVTLLPRNCVDRVFSSPEEYNNFSGEEKIRMCLGVLDTDSKYRSRITGIIRDLIEML